MTRAAITVRPPTPNSDPRWKQKCIRVPSSACGCMRPRGNLTQPTTTNEGDVKPRKKLRLPTGAKSVLISGGVGSGKVLVWHHIEWCSSRDVLQRWVAPALTKQFLGRRCCCILEDNDPTGNYSGRGLKAKEEMKLVPLCIPKRSSDLNVLGYAIWNEVASRMHTTCRFVCKWGEHALVHNANEWGHGLKIPLRCYESLCRHV